MFTPLAFNFYDQYGGSFLVDFMMIRANMSFSTFKDTFALHVVALPNSDPDWSAYYMKTLEDIALTFHFYKDYLKKMNVAHEDGSSAKGQDLFRHLGGGRYYEWGRVSIDYEVEPIGSSILVEYN